MLLFPNNVLGNVEQSNDRWAYSQLGYSKDGLMEKGLQRIILDFYYIYYFMIIVDWYMTITRMMSC